MKERLAKIGRVAAATGLFVSTALGFDAGRVFAGGGCPDVPAEDKVICPNPSDYATGRFRISWIEGREFRIESQTRFLGFLWETPEGTTEGIKTLVRLCGGLSDAHNEGRLFQDAVRVRTTVNPRLGCLIHDNQQQIGGGGE